MSEFVPLLFGQKTSPHFFWDFRSGTVPSGSTFTRGSAGWFFNSAGVLTQASTNVPRFDYDPVTLAPLGYLAEMQSTNAITSSQNFAGTGWSSTALTLTNNAVAAPDGTTTAATIKEDGTTAAHILRFDTWSETLNSVYGVSIFVKNISGSRWIQPNITGSFFVNFQPSTGTIGSNSANVSSVVARQIANGWWRLSFLFTGDATGATSLRLYMANASNAAAAPSYTGDNTSTIAVWGAQVETAGVGITSYIPTSGSTVTRSQDILSLPLTSLPGWNASKGGVLVTTGRLHTSNPSAPGFSQWWIQLDDTTNNNVVLSNAMYSGGGFRRSFVNSGGVAQIDIGSAVASPAVFVRSRQALGWGTSRGQLAVDGVLGATTSGAYSLPTGLTRLQLANTNGTLESVAYYAGARPDAEIVKYSL